MQKKRKLQENAFKFLRKIFIRLYKESSSLPRQSLSNCHCSCSLHLKRRENICVCYPFHRMFQPRDVPAQGELESDCPMIKELSWDTSSTENFWLEVHLYKDPKWNFLFQLFSLGVLKMFYLPLLTGDKWCMRQLVEL